MHSRSYHIALRFASPQYSTASLWVSPQLLTVQQRAQHGDALWSDSVQRHHAAQLGMTVAITRARVDLVYRNGHFDVYQPNYSDYSAVLRITHHSAESAREFGNDDTHSTTIAHWYTESTGAVMYNSRHWPAPARPAPHCIALHCTLLH